MCFSEDLNRFNNYENTLWHYVISQKDDYLLFGVTDEDWEGFFELYGLDMSLLETIEEIEPRIKYANYLTKWRGSLFDDERSRFYKDELDEIIKRDLCLDKSEQFNYEKIFNESKKISDKNLDSRNFLNCMFYNYYVRKVVKKVRFDNSKESLIKNRQLYMEITNYLTWLNSNVGTWNILDNKIFDQKQVPLGEAIADIGAISRILTIVEKIIYDQTKDLLELLYEAFNYLIIRYVDTVWLILSLQLVRCSPLFSEQERDFSKNLIDIFLGLFREARIIKIFKNENFFNRSIPQESRISKSQTTRFQILYEYSNGDQYSVRLDLSHENVESFHLNSLSKGKVSYFPLEKKKYLEVVAKNKEYEGWFINYGNDYYFLRERKASELKKDKVKHEELIEALKKNEHFVMANFDNEDIVISVLESWKKVFTKVSEDMPLEKLEPRDFYKESYIYEWIYLYFCKKMFNKTYGEENFYNEEELKGKLINAFYKRDFFTDTDISELKIFSIPDIISLAKQ